MISKQDSDCNCGEYLRNGLPPPIVNNAENEISIAIMYRVLHVTLHVSNRGLTILSVTPGAGNYCSKSTVSSFLSPRWCL